MTTDDHDKVLKDGEFMRVPHMLMDGRSQSRSERTFVAEDHRPRYANLTADQRAAALERQAVYDRRVSNAWRHTEPGNSPAEGRIGALHLDRAAHDPANHLRAVREDIQKRYDSRVSNAWKMV